MFPDHMASVTPRSPALTGLFLAGALALAAGCGQPGTAPETPRPDPARAAPSPTDDEAVIAALDAHLAQAALEDAGASADAGAVTDAVEPAGAVGAACSAADQAITAEEYEVYIDLIRERYSWEGVETVVVESRTTIHHANDEASLDGMREQAAKIVAGQMKSAGADVIQDFEKKNDTMYTLCPGLFKHRPGPDGKAWIGLGPAIQLISPSEIEEMFGKGKGWKEFYEIHPASQGILTLSRVGFNAGRTKALLYAGNQSDWLAGAGFYLLLERKGDHWKVVAEVEAWIS